MLVVEHYGEVMQIKLGRDMDGMVLYWTAAYLVDGLLIDTGCAYTASELLDFLRDKRIEQVVITHHHEDHVGGNALLKRELGVEIAAHPRAAPLVIEKPALHRYQELVWGYPEPAPVLPIPAVIKTPGFSFRVVETPGHSPDHIALVEPHRGWCFCGDLFVSENQKTLRADEDIGLMEDSLRKLLAQPADPLVLFTGIGKVFPDGRKAVVKFLGHLARVREEATRLSGRGLSAEEIRDRIFGRESQLAGLTDGHFSTLNLVRQLIDADA